MKIAITGSSGYIGTHFVRLAQAEGHEIIFLSRVPPLSISYQWIYYNLTDLTPPLLPNDVNYILHLAYQKDGGQLNKRVNELRAVKNVILAAKKINARVIFLSSQAASINSPSFYGQLKWELEQLFYDSCNIVIRPGFVYGGMPKGLFLAIVNILRNNKFIPLFFPSPKIQPIHIQDLCVCLLKIMLLNNSAQKIYFLGAIKPIKFTLFMQVLSNYYAKKRNIFIPVPTYLLFILLTPLKNIFLKSSQILSLLSLPPMNPVNSLNILNYNLNSSIILHCLQVHPYKALLQEGFIIYSYITRRKPTIRFLRKYVRLIILKRGSLPLQLPNVFIYFPLSLCAYEQSNEGLWSQELNYRIQSGCLLSEASTEGALQLLKTDNDSFVKTCLTIFAIFLRELMLRFLGIIIRQLVFQLPPRSWVVKL